MNADAPFGLQPGHTSIIRCVEGEMLSYHAGADSHTHPFKSGVDHLVNLDMQTGFIGKAALQRIQAQTGRAAGRYATAERVKHHALAAATSAPRNNWATAVKLTSAIYSVNTALAMVAVGDAELGTALEIQTSARPAHTVIVEKPFLTPNSRLPCRRDSRLCQAVMFKT